MPPEHPSSSKDAELGKVSPDVHPPQASTAGGSILSDAIRLPLNRFIFMKQLGARESELRITLNHSSTMASQATDVSFADGGGVSFDIAEHSRKLQQRKELAYGLVLAIICAWDIASDAVLAKVLWSGGCKAAFGACIGLIGLQYIVGTLLLGLFGFSCIKHLLLRTLLSPLLIAPLDAIALAMLHFLPSIAQHQSSPYRSLSYNLTRLEVCLRQHMGCRLLVRTVLESLPMIVLQIAVLAGSRGGGELSSGDLKVVGMSLAASITVSIAAVVALLSLVSNAEGGYVKGFISLLKYEGVDPVPGAWLNRLKGKKGTTTLDLSSKEFVVLNRMTWLE